jgi:hypothetical protein
MTSPRRCLPLLVLLLGAAVAPERALHAQTCYGTPRRGGLAFEYGDIPFGNTVGVGGALAGKHVAFGAGYRHLDLGSATSGNGGLARLALVLGSRVQVCPGLSLDYEQQRWESRRSGTMTSRQLTGRAGVGIGGEVPVYRGLAVIPFVVGQYAYTAVAYDLDVPNADAQITGDTTSRGDLEYGALARFRFLYGGATASHFAQKGQPYRTRFVIGVTFAGAPDRPRRGAR